MGNKNSFFKKSKDTSEIPPYTVSKPITLYTYMKEICNTNKENNKKLCTLSVWLDFLKLYTNDFTSKFGPVESRTSYTEYAILMQFMLLIKSFYCNAQQNQINLLDDENEIQKTLAKLYRKIGEHLGIDNCSIIDDKIETVDLNTRPYSFYLMSFEKNIYLNMLTTFINRDFIPQRSISQELTIQKAQNVVDYISDSFEALHDMMPFIAYLYNGLLKCDDKDNVYKMYSSTNEYCGNYFYIDSNHESKELFNSILKENTIFNVDDEKNIPLLAQNFIFFNSNTNQLSK